MKIPIWDKMIPTQPQPSQNIVTIETKTDTAHQIHGIESSSISAARWKKIANAIKTKIWV